MKDERRHIRAALCARIPHPSSLIPHQSAIPHRATGREGFRHAGRLVTGLLVGLAAQLAVGQPSTQSGIKDEATRPATDTPSLPAPALQGIVEQVKQFMGGQASQADAITASQRPPVPGWAPSDEEGVIQTETGLLDVHVRDTEISTVLEMLSYQARANIVTSTTVTGSVSANLYSVTLEQALAAILTPNQYAFHVVGNTVFVGTDKEIAVFQPPATRVFKLRYIRPAEAAAAVKGVLGPAASVVEGGSEFKASSGKEATMSEVGVDYLIVTDYPERLTLAERVLAKIDQRPRQVLVESTVLRATLSETNQFGIDFTMLGGVDFENVGSSSNASADLRTGLLPTASLQDTTFNVNTKFTGAVNDGGFTFGLIKNNIASFVRALEEVTDVVVVANPKLVALNKQESEVIVGRRDGYLTTTVTETAAIQTVQFLETGTQIKFRPVINDDGTVRLSVHPKDSNGGLSAANLPFEETTEAHADILVNDGNTILIGGLFRERTVNSKSQLPVLGNIPWAGLLFGSRNDQTTREEVIILLTIHVLQDTDEEQQRFRVLLDDVERIRVGSRRGLLGTGRERLAQAFFHEALRQCDEGNRERALLNLRMTLNNEPKHMPAIKLLERLTEERLWDDEGTRMRTFIWDLIPPRPLPQPPPAPPIFGRPQIDTDLLEAADECEERPDE